jgi:His-Xaa-Ser system protein HxsD
MNEKKMNYTIEGGRICISLYRLFYQKEAVLAAAQKMTGDYYIEIKSLDSERAGIYLEPKVTGSGEALTNIIEEVAKNFCNEVIDQQVRLDLEKRYGKLRELIVRQAFAPITVDELSKELKKDNALE